MEKTNITFALYFGNRGFFPGEVIAEARDEVKNAGFDYICMDENKTRCGAVETITEGKLYADFLEENSIGDAIRLVGDKLTSFHTGENNRTAPGKGHLDWDEIFGALAEIGYKDRIVCEPFVMMGGEVGRDIHVFRDLIDNPSETRIDEEAKYILNFEKAMMKKHNM